MNICLIREYIFDNKINEHIVLEKCAEEVFSNLYKDVMGYKIYLYSLKCIDGVFFVDKLKKYKSNNSNSS